MGRITPYGIYFPRTFNLRSDNETHPVPKQVPLDVGTGYRHHDQTIQPINRASSPDENQKLDLRFLARWVTGHAAFSPFAGRWTFTASSRRATCRHFLQPAALVAAAQHSPAVRRKGRK